MVAGGLLFVSSRRRHTRLQGDWSSDVCSSDLGQDSSSPAAGVHAGLSRSPRNLIRRARSGSWRTRADLEVRPIEFYFGWKPTSETTTPSSPLSAAVGAMVLSREKSPRATSPASMLAGTSRLYMNWPACV